MGIQYFDRGAGIHHSNIGCPSIMTSSKMDKTKNLIFYSLSAPNVVVEMAVIKLMRSNHFGTLCIAHKIHNANIKYQSCFEYGTKKMDHR